MGFCSCTSKFVIVVINIVLWIGAGLMIAGGVAYLNQADGVTDHVHHEYSYVIFAIGGVLFLVGLIGIAGACSEKKFLLGIFVIVALAAFALLLYSTVTLFVKHDNAMNETDKFLLKQFNNYGNPNLTSAMELSTDMSDTTSSPSSGSGNSTTTAPSGNITTTTISTTAVPATTAAPIPDMNATDFIDNIQSSLHCCGFNGYADWDTYDCWKKLGNGGYVPHSCCNETAAKATNGTCAVDKISVKNQTALIYTDDCKTEIHTVVNVFYHFMNYTALAFTILVLLGVFASVYLMCRKRSSDGFNYSSIVA